MSLKDVNCFMKSVESCNALTVMNTSTLLEYVAKKKDVTCASHLITTIRIITFKMNSWSIDVLTIIKITWHEWLNASKEKRMWRRSNWHTQRDWDDMKSANMSKMLMQWASDEMNNQWVKSWAIKQVVQWVVK